MKVYKTAVENLQAARKLLRTRWITGDLAILEDGTECSPRNPKAHSFCALGAVRHANGPGEVKAVKALQIAARDILEAEGYFEDMYSRALRNGLIFEVNDSYGKNLTLKMFERAIKIAKQ